MNQQQLDDLIMAATQAENEEAVLRLSKEIPNVDPALLKQSSGNFDLLFDAWEESIYKSEEKSSICLFLAEHSVMDSPSFRLALHSAIRNFLPPYISSPAVAKAVGARDNSLGIHEIAQRIRKLQHLKTNAYVYMLESRSWGRVMNVDKVVATLAVVTFGTNGQISLPISSALNSCYFFEANAEMTNIIATGKSTLKDSAYYKEKIRKYALGDLSETKHKEIIQKMFVPALLTQEAFNDWWEKAPEKSSASPAKRTFRNARSILELQVLLKEADPEDITVTMEEAAKLSMIFKNVRPGMNSKDQEMFASCMAELAMGAETEIIQALFDTLRGKVPFFPQTVTSSIPLKNLETWGRLPVKLFPGFLKVAKILYSSMEIAKLAMILPLRCINVIFESISMDDITDALFMTEHPHSDILLSIWKNKSKYSDEVKEYLTMANISHALSEENLPKEWTAAQRELKRNLFEKADFQKFILAVAGANVPSIISAVMRMRNTAPGECQSLLVKLSQHSEALKNHIESGEGAKVMAAQSQKHDTPTKAQEAPMTSLLSYKGLIEELDDIIKVQIPENTKAIEYARSFGDFRENAEYDAAKERRSFLRRRRADLETLVATVQPVNFVEFKADTSRVSMGTAVTLCNKADGTEKVYYLLGAWDGNPDLNRISYKTKFGEAILGARTGNEIKLPDGSLVTVSAIEVLPAELAKELSPAE
ncbi:MAG: GreA/GreB family elongation factor [Lentisphaeria bacterium]|nr:GreA/GreB family elongation factor [Lentisphaeria bacterium]